MELTNGAYQYAWWIPPQNSMQWWSTVNVCTSIILKITKCYRVEQFENIWLQFALQQLINLGLLITYRKDAHIIFELGKKYEDHDCFMVNEMIYTHRTRKCCENLGKLQTLSWSIPRRHREKSTCSKKIPVNWEFGKWE